MIAAAFKYTEDYWIDSLIHYRQLRGRLTIFVEFILALSLLVIAIWMFYKNSKFISFFFLIMGVFCFLSDYIERWMAKRNFSKLQQGNLTYSLEISEEGISVKFPKPENKVSWSVFTKVVHFKNGVLLLRHRSRFFMQLQTPLIFDWLPFSALENFAQKKELENLLREKIKVHQEIRK